MSERLSQKEIKQDIREDEVLHYITQTLNWVVTHRRELIAAGIGLVVLVFAFAGFTYMGEKKAGEASLAFSRALEVAQAPIVAEGAMPDDADAPSFPDAATRSERARELFEAVRADYAGTGAGQAATVHLGRIALEAGNPEGARTLWEEFLDRNDEHMLAASVKVALLSLDRDAGKGDEVVTALESELAASKPTLPQDLALYQLAITLEELDRTEEAADAYRRLGDEHPESPFAPQALAKARELGAPEPAVS